MAILATFVVSATVPHDWSLESGRSLPVHHGDSPFHPLAMGLRAGAALTVSDDGIAPATAPEPGKTVAPRVLRARVSLSTTSGASPRAAVHIDRSLTHTFRAGDAVSFARTGCGCFGLALVRAGQLVVACGSVSGLYLGAPVSVRPAYEELQEAEAVFRRTDDGFRFHETPVAVTIGARTRFLCGGRLQLNGYHIWVERGHLSGVPGRSECVAIWREGACPDVVAIASAQLLDYRIVT